MVLLRPGNALKVRGNATSTDPNATRVGGSSDTALVYWKGSPNAKTVATNGADWCQTNDVTCARISDVDLIGVSVSLTGADPCGQGGGTSGPLLP